MKNPKLWSEIRKFDFDQPSDVYGFSLRLAKENLWTREFTLNAIEEYRRFMYLAAISEQMVSPSHIIDQVWHLHLIYTKSYDQLCEILSKKVQHVPATHNPQEGRIYMDARSRTNVLYEQEFGAQSPEIWANREMTDSLNLPKAKYKLRAFIIAGLFTIAALTPLFYFLLRPIYSEIGPANFIAGYLIITAILFVVLNVFNRASMTRTFGEFPLQSFIQRFTPSELIYLQYNRTEAVANGFINHLVKQGNIIVHDTDGSVESGKNEPLYTQEEIQITELLQSTGRTTYSVFIKKLLARNIFSNLELCLEAAKKYYHKSQSYHRLFYINFCLLAVVFILGFERIMTGVMRDKPIVIITVIVLIILIAIIIHLFYLNKLMFSRIIPDAYEKKIKSNASARSDWQWNYFLQGTAVFAPAFLLVANMSYVEQMNTTNNRSGSGGTSCGSSCGGGGSSCGSSCGGGSCGGCGGGD